MMGKYLGIDITSLIAPSPSSVSANRLRDRNKRGILSDQKQPTGYHHDKMTKNNRHIF